MKAKVRLAVAGAGLIGRRHLEEIAAGDCAELAGVVDPGPAGAELAQEHAIPLYPSLSSLLAAKVADGVILATPNRLHVAGGLECVAAGLPVLVEKPIGDSVEEATRLVEAGESAGVPVLTGHHRNYSPILSKAREIVASGVLGRIVAVAGTAPFYKPDGYFDDHGGWRRKPGAGPILLNLIHEINNLQLLVGDIVRVQATRSAAVRGFPVEDTAALVLTFAGGALGTFLLSDTAASARSWEQTAGENASYSRDSSEDCYHVAGTFGSLSIPTLRLMTYPGPRSWWEPFETTTIPVDRSDPLAHQIAHFAAVIRGEAAPICSGRDGLKSLQVVEAVLTAARTGAAVELRY